MKKLVFLTMLIVSVLSGCAAPVQKYTLSSDTQAYAEVKSNVQGAYDRNESIQIFVMGEGGCGYFNFDHIENQRSLFTIKNSIAEPQGFVKVAVDKPLRLRYYEVMSGGRTCEIMIETKMAAGKKYALDGGFQYKDGVIPILLGSRSCNLGVRSEANSEPPAIKRLFKSTLCD